MQRNRADEQTQMKFERTAIVSGTPEEVFALTQGYGRLLQWEVDALRKKLGHFNILTPDRK